MIKLGITHESRFVMDSLKILCSHNTQEIIFEEFTLDCLCQADFISTDILLISELGFLEVNSLNSNFVKNHKIIVFGRFNSKKIIGHFIHKGANCYIKNSESHINIIDAIKILNHSELYCPYPIDNLFSKSHSKVVADFSERELEIFSYLRKGYTNREVAQKLKLHLRTIEFHRKNIIEKTGSKNILGALDYLITHELIPILIL